jgi:hypothetical protein
MLNVAVIRILAALLLAGVIIPLYFLPGIIGRKKRGKVAIFVLNLLLGWTVVGWIAVFIWAIRADQAVTPQSSAWERAVLPEYCSKCETFSVPGSSLCRTCGRQFKSFWMEDTFRPNDRSVVGG